LFAILCRIRVADISVYLDLVKYLFFVLIPNEANFCPKIFNAFSFGDTVAKIAAVGG